MKAVIVDSYGPPSVAMVKEVAKPVPKKNEVLIQVHATTVNRTDCGIRQGNYFLMRCFTGLFKPSSPILGTDYAGRVTGVGSEVHKFSIGDHVFGFNDNGISSHAEFMTISEDKNISTIPDGLPFNEAVASLEGVHYAYNFFFKTKLRLKSRILINGTTGAIGSALLQILVSEGHMVDAVCGTKHVDLVKSLGAAHVFDYEKEDFTKTDKRYHVVFDAVGKSRFTHCKALLEDKGLYLSSELGKNGENIYLPFTTLFNKKRVIFPIPFDCQRSLKLIKELIEKKQFKPLIDKSYSIDEIADAYEYAESGKKVGNIILSISTK